MSEQKQEKKVVSRTVAIAIGIVLLVILAGAIADFASTINNENNTISSQDSQISNLQSKVSNLTNILNLFNSMVWVNQKISQPANSSTKWTFSAKYAGYAYVSVVTNSSPGTVVIQATYNSYAVYDQMFYQTSAYFPILPSTNVQIIVSDTNPNGLTGTVTITYHY